MPLGGADRREVCLAQGHGQGFLVRVTSKAHIKSKKLTVRGGKKEKILQFFCIVQSCATLHICVRTLVNPHYT